MKAVCGHYGAHSNHRVFDKPQDHHERHSVDKETRHRSRPLVHNPAKHCCRGSGFQVCDQAPGSMPLRQPSQITFHPEQFRWLLGYCDKSPRHPRPAQTRGTFRHLPTSPQVLAH